MTGRFVFACVLGAVAIGACTGSDPTTTITPLSDGGAASGAGEDAASSIDSGVSTDAAVDAQCPVVNSGPPDSFGSGVACGGPMCSGEPCCIRPSSHGCSATRCETADITWTCDDATDCGGTQGCFAVLSVTGCALFEIGAAGSACYASAPPAGATQLCARSEECTPGLRCLVATASVASTGTAEPSFTTTIGVCAP